MHSAVTSQRSRNLDTSVFGSILAGKSRIHEYRNPASSMVVPNINLGNEPGSSFSSIKNIEDKITPIKKVFK